MNGTMWIVLAVIVVIVLILAVVALSRRSKDDGAHAQRPSGGTAGKATATGAGAAGAAGVGAAAASRRRDDEPAEGATGATSDADRKPGADEMPGSDDQLGTGDKAGAEHPKHADDPKHAEDAASSSASPGESTEERTDPDDVQAAYDGPLGAKSQAETDGSPEADDPAEARTETIPTLGQDADREYFGDHDDVRAPDGSDDTLAAGADQEQDRPGSDAEEDPSKAPTDVIPVGPRDDSPESVPNDETGEESGEEAAPTPPPVVDETRRAPGQVAPAVSQEPVGGDTREPATADEGSAEDPLDHRDPTTPGAPTPTPGDVRPETADADEWAAPQPSGEEHEPTTPGATTPGANATSTSSTSTGAGASAASAGGAAGAGQKIQDLRQKVQEGAKERWNRPGQDGQTPGDKFSQLREKVEGEVRGRMQNRSDGSQTGGSDGPGAGGLRDKVDEGKQRVEDGIRRFRNRGGNSSSGQ